MECAVRALGADKVRVNAFCPGMVMTELNKSFWDAWNRQQETGKQQSYDDWADEKIRRVVPLGRWQTPEEMAAMTVYLASAHGKNITGQCVNVDGGFVMDW